MAKNHVFVPLLHKYWMNLYWLYWMPHVILRPSPMSLCHLHVLHSSEFPTVSRLPTPSQHSDIPLPRILIKGLHIFDAFQVKFPRLHRSWLIVTTPPTKRLVESRLYKKKGPVCFLCKTLLQNFCPKKVFKQTQFNCSFGDDVITKTNDDGCKFQPKKLLML